MIIAGSSLSIVLNPKHCVEVLLRSGRRLTFGNLLDREGTIRLLRAARTQAQHEQASGLHQWRPRRIELHEPLSVHNLLPCTLHATLTQQGEWRGGGPTATPVRGPEPRVVADAMADAVGGTVGGTAASAAGLVPTELRPALVEVFDWWDPHLKQLTFHAGEAWGREERKDVQFLALGPRAGARDDTVAVLDWWDPQAQKLVFHPEGPRGAEERKAVQFYGLAAPRAGTCPVHEFWNERLGQLTIHAGEPWEGERRRATLFHAYPVEHVRTPGEETHRIASAVRRPLHTMHLLTPLRLTLWLGGPTYAEARLHGHLVVSRPAATERDDDGTLLRRYDLTLHPPHQPMSPLSLRVEVAVRGGAAGSAAVSVGAATWLLNETSVPLALYDAMPTGPRIELEPGLEQAQPFSLALEGKSARVASHVAGSGGPASSDGLPRALGFDSATSEKFSVEAVGNESTLVVHHGRRGAAELSLSISRSSGKLAAANAIVLTLHDRYSIRNRSHLELEWRQAPAPAVSAAAAAAAPPTAVLGALPFPLAAAPAAAPAEEPLAPSASGAEVEAEAQAHVLQAEGRAAPLFWRERDGARLIQLRPTSGEHAWCACRVLL